MAIFFQIVTFGTMLLICLSPNTVGKTLPEFDESNAMDISMKLIEKNSKLNESYLASKMIRDRRSFHLQACDKFCSEGKGVCKFCQDEEEICNTFTKTVCPKVINPAAKARDGKPVAHVIFKSVLNTAWSMISGQPSAIQCKEVETVECIKVPTKSCELDDHCRKVECPINCRAHWENLKGKVTILQI